MLNEEARESENDNVKCEAIADDANAVRGTMLSEALARGMTIRSTEETGGAGMVG